MFIAWIKFQRRASSMQPFFNFNLQFILPIFQQRKLKIFDYFGKGIETLWMLLKRRPKTLWVQLPPTPLLNIALIYKRFFNKNMIIIADCHNGLFSDKWARFLGNCSTLNKADLILVHNHVIERIAIERGVKASKLLVLETKPAYKNTQNISSYNLNIQTPWILMPCAFAIDEPISVVFEAAKLIPEIQILISGDTRRAVGIHDLNKIPENVTLTGYLSEDDYESLFIQAHAILGLTTESHIQLSVANEATGFEKPMILSDTELLRDLFNKGAVYVDTLSPMSLAEGIKTAILNKDSLAEDVRVLKIERNKKWEMQATRTKEAIKKLSLQ
ncbi:hypothetical protein C8N28_0242 [Albibacterium bauzanense]|uniref:Glycosyltransferase involved in cell wall biosynthesis n=2 Tax=Albibacterium bauzanense TaxID=653929 RepID=A0A4R1LZD0_9SPHI|nr:hypothetical protein C8N28_0242 [Albibacterium bauzanense]